MNEFLAELHPATVHFPIALLILYCATEAASFFVKREGFSIIVNVLLFLGVVSALGSVLTGNMAFEAAKELTGKGISVPLSLIEDHEWYATAAVWYFFALTILRTYFLLKKKLDLKVRIIFLLLALAGGYLIYETGRTGAGLVYKHGIGTELLKEKIDLEK